MKLYSILLFGIIIGSITMLSYGKYSEIIKSADEWRATALEAIDSGIEKAKLEGRYGCCIDPPCKMCFLGNWIWKDGSCYCDEMIKKGEWDKVCPECKRGIEEGRCKSSDNTREICPILPIENELI